MAVSGSASASSCSLFLMKLPARSFLKRRQNRKAAIGSVDNG